MKKLKTKIKNFFKTRKSYHYVRYVLSAILIGLMIAYKILLIIFPLVLLVAFLVVMFSGMAFRKRATGNGIIYGGRGKGKGLLLNYLIRKDKTKPYCNVQYGKSEFLPDISEYLNCVQPLTIDNFINNDFKVNKGTFIVKTDKFEKRNVYIDDINVYLPNWADSLLKKKYDSMPPMLAINRHLFDAYCIITTQDRERPYKILKELQSDFSIKAVHTFGWGWFWLCIPILHNFVYTKYIWHELPKSADMLPFQAKGLVNETLKHGYLTSGQATKEVYEATNGKIRYGFCLQLKRYLDYDTRAFHSIVYGKKAPK